MPSEKLERRSQLVLKQFKTMDIDNIPPNNSSAELVRREDTNQDSASVETRTLRSVKLKEWVAVSILCFINLINYMDRFTLAGILTDIVTHFGISNDLAGLLQTAFILSYMLFAPLFGYLGDRFSRRWIMACGVLLWSLTTLFGSYMSNFWWFLLFRALVGVGEASYSTIAPTIISDLFISDIRSKMLAFFYFAIPVGSGMGYIVGSEIAIAMNSWKWALRVTPALGILAVILIIFVLDDPERGQSEGSGHMEPTSWCEDVNDIVKNKSFMLSTAGFTCVAFVAGALAWWGPTFIAQGIKLHGGASENTPYIFGVVSMFSGIIGVPLGSAIAQRFRPINEQVDTYICALGLLISSPLVYLALITARYNSTLCYIFIFLGELSLNLMWAIVADIVLYVVLPTRRSTAEGFQLLVSHAFGDAGSPYLIGVISDAIVRCLSTDSSNSTNEEPSDEIKFTSMQYALFLTCFVEILGGVFFLINSIYVVQDKRKVEKAIHGGSLLVNESDQSSS